MLAAVALAGACGRVPDATFAQANEARQRAADLRVELAKAVGASDRAVMADTDQASIASAREADRAKAAVQADAAALAPLLQSLEYRNEAKYLSEFQAHFEEYSKEVEAMLADDRNKDLRTLAAAYNYRAAPYVLQGITAVIHAQKLEAKIKELEASTAEKIKAAVRADRERVKGLPSATSRAGARSGSAAENEVLDARAAMDKAWSQHVKG